ncbi:hypothetical protein GCM10010282_15680 [Streptomyces roseolus]|nr:hypothetical protein GCM10010282_15680 [Streptomyces roseolus]
MTAAGVSGVAKAAGGIPAARTPEQPPVTGRARRSGPGPRGGHPCGGSGGSISPVRFASSRVAVLASVRWPRAM